MTCPNCGWEPWEPDHDADGVGFPDDWGVRPTHCAACDRETQHLVHFNADLRHGICVPCFCGEPTDAPDFVCEIEMEGLTR